MKKILVFFIFLFLVTCSEDKSKKFNSIFGITYKLPENILVYNHLNKEDMLKISNINQENVKALLLHLKLAPSRTGMPNYYEVFLNPLKISKEADSVILQKGDFDLLEELEKYYDNKVEKFCVDTIKTNKKIANAETFYCGLSSYGTKKLVTIHSKHLVKKEFFIYSIYYPLGKSTLLFTLTCKENCKLWIDNLNFIVKTITVE